MTMKRRMMAVGLVLSFMLAGCATLNLNPHKTQYDHAVSFFNDAWVSYHKVWVALEDEEEKTEWVEKYHTKFLKAGEFLQKWAETPDNPNMDPLWQALKIELETLLIKLAIRD